MDIAGHFLLSISIFNHFTGVLCQCDGNTLPVPAPNLDRVVFSYPINSSVSYDENLDCKWLFESTNASLVFVFHVTNLLVDCGDVLKVYDGSSRSASPLTSAICSDSTSITPLYTTSSNQMLVSFQTDGQTRINREKGFTFNILSAKTTAYDLDACNSNTKTLTATTDEQYITSPFFPENYRSNTSCMWNITTQTETVSIIITVRFLDMDVDQLNSACTDYISVSDGQTEQVLCSSASFDPQISTSNTSFALIKFYSDDNTEGRGFLLVYNILEDQTTSSTTTDPTTTGTTTSIETTTTDPTTIETTTTGTTTSIETTTTGTTTSIETTTTGTTTSTTTLITTITETTAPTTTATMISTSSSSTVSTITSRPEESSPSPTVSSTASSRLTPRSEVTSEAVIVLTVFSFLVLVVSITATTVMCFSKIDVQRRHISITSSDSQPQSGHWSHYFDEISTVHNHYRRAKYTHNEYNT